LSYASSKGRRWRSIGSLGLLSLQRFGSLYCWRAISREEAKRLFRTGKANVPDAGATHPEVDIVSPRDARHSLLLGHF